MIGGKPQQSARKSSTGRCCGGLRDDRHWGISSQPPRCQHANAGKCPQTVLRQQQNSMNEEQPYVSASQPKKPCVGQGKVVVCHQEPGADARQDHFDAHEGRLPIAEDKGHDGIGFLSTALEEQQRTQGIERRGPEHTKEQPHCTLGRAVHIRSGCLACAAKPSASPTYSQGTPERRRMRAAIKLPTPLGDDNSGGIIHVVLALSARLSYRTACGPWHLHTSMRGLISSQKSLGLSTPIIHLGG
jgi:hypothetical protein